MIKLFEFARTYPIETLPVFLTIFPIATFIYRKSYQDPALRYLFFMLFLKLIIDFKMLHLAMNGTNNIVYYNLWVGVSFILSSYMIYNYLDVMKDKIILKYTAFLFVFLWACDFYNTGMLRTVEYTPTIQCFLMCLYILIFFFEIIKSLKVDDLQRYSGFWVCSSLLIYYSATLFTTPIYSLYNVAGAGKDLVIIATIPYVFESIYLLLIGVSVLTEK